MDCIKIASSKGWNKTILKNVYSYGKAGGTPLSTNKSFYGGKIPFLTISDISVSGKYIEKTEKFITQLGLDNSSAWLVDEKSLILSMYASYGKVCINRIPLATSQALFSMKIRDDYDLEFLYQLLTFLKRNNYWDIFVKTGSQPNINKEIVENAVVNIPNYDEQLIIGSFLGGIDSLIEEKKNELEKTKQYKEAMLYKMFPKEGSKVPEIRFKGFEGEWTNKTIGQIYEIYNGLNKEKEAFGFGVPIINYMDVNKNTYITDEMIKGRVSLSAEEIRNNIVNKNDILFARTSEVIDEVAFSSCYYGDCKNVVFSGFLLKGSPLKGVDIDSRFVALYVKYCNAARSQINRIATKTSRALINGENLKKLEIKLPKFKEQNKIVDFFLNLDDYIDSCFKEINILENYKATLLEKMFA